MAFGGRGRRERSLARFFLACRTTKRSADFSGIENVTRKLTEEERKLWDRVRGLVVPMHSAREEIVPAGGTGAAEKPTRSARAGTAKAVQADRNVPGAGPVGDSRERIRIPEFRIGEKSAGDVGGRDSSAGGSTGDNFRQPAVKDRKLRKNLKRGSVSPEDRIDLHGLTVDQARPALTRFIGRSHANGLRLVLVITGKGRDREGPIPERGGVLRRQAPAWLSGPGLKHAVREVQEALPQHGGGGAFYVWLRRRR